MEKYFPLPLVFKEWKEWRWPLVIACLLIVLPMSLKQSWWINQSWQFEWNRATVISSNAPTGLFASFVFAGLGAALVGMDRSRGVLWHTLSGPVTRLDLLRVKFVFGLAAIAATFVAEMFVFCLLRGDSTSAVIRWAIADAAIQSSVYATAFMVSFAVGNVVLAAICGFGVAAAPMLFAAGIYEMTGFGVNGGISRLAPLTYLNQPLDDYFGVVLWCVIWAYGCYVIARKMFVASNAEHFSSVFIFPSLKKWARMVVCCFAGFVATVILSKPNPNPVVGLFLFALFTWLASFFWRKVAERIRPIQA